MSEPVSQVEIIPAGGTERRPVEAAIASSILPWPYDDSKSLYLSYRACGLSVREALKITGNAESTLSFWRKDQKFLELENRIPDIRRQLSVLYTEIEFFRNFRMVLEKDRRVLYRSLNPEKDEDGIEQRMDVQDFEYLLKMRTQYTAQQLQILAQITNQHKGQGEDEKDFNWMQWITEHPDALPGRVEVTRTDTVKLG